MNRIILNVRKIFSVVIIGGLLICSESPQMEDRFLFCLQSTEDVLELTLTDRGPSTGIPHFDVWIAAQLVNNIEPWLPTALPTDHSGDVYLNRIYRLIISEENRNSITSIRNDLEQFSFIHSTEPEYIREPFYTPNDPMYSNQWFLPQVNANNAWEFWNIPGGDYPGDSNVMLASVDTGVDWDHPDLVNNLWQNLGEDADGDGHTIEYIDGSWVLDPGDINLIDDDNWDGDPASLIDDLIGWDFSGWNGDQDNDPIPKTGVSPYSTWSHGTHVAGLLAASTDNNTGVASTAYNCNIMSVKVSREQQTGTPYVTEGYSGILYAAQAGHFSGGFTIINNSWGGVGYSNYEQDVIDVSHNIYNAVIFAAAGNGEGGELYGTLYPASYEYMISVTALGTNDNWNHWANYHESVDLASPGENIRSTIVGNYASWTGTSMATPVAASCAGLLQSYYPEWTAEHLETMIVATADPVIYEINSEPYLEDLLGQGRVDILQAISVGLYPKLEIAGYDLYIENDTDGQLNPGEEGHLWLILFNHEDWGDAFDITGYISVESADVEIILDNSDFPDLAAGEAGLNETVPFVFTLDADFNSDTISFTITINSNEYGTTQYESDLYLTLPVTLDIVIPGDMNNDEFVDVLDVITFVNIILDELEVTEYHWQAGDLNDDSSLDILDIILIVNLILTNN